VPQTRPLDFHLQKGFQLKTTFPHTGQSQSPARGAVFRAGAAVLVRPAHVEKG